MEKDRLKQEYKLKLKAIKANYKKAKDNARDEYFSKQHQKNLLNPPKRSVIEEVGNAVSHGLGTLFSIIACALMLQYSDTLELNAGAIIYSAGLFIMFTISCLYHSFKNGTAVKRLFRRFDYCCIYLLIGATFAPILLNYIGGKFGMLFFGVQWIVIIVGVTFVAVFGQEKLKVVHIIMYLAIGWSGLAFIPRMLANNVGLFWYILGGGVIYSLGIIPFLMKKSAAHFIWHLFVLGGAMVQWLGIYQFIYQIAKNR